MLVITGWCVLSRKALLRLTIYLPFLNLIVSLPQETPSKMVFFERKNFGLFKQRRLKRKK
ncbi:MAG: hypothetical protein B5M53_10620 [Candidatus Cloacimonas sp. 4484_209]|nr:MAG: hypothetical protein B5M53_10620 [Candidatus Cloacimonas sp. 4484_209]